MELSEVVTSLEDRRHRRSELREATNTPTGSLGLDLALGGGWGLGRICELSGDYSTYKSSFALHTVAQAQKFGRVLWLDSGSDFNLHHAARAGVDLTNLVVYCPEDADRAMYTMRVAAGDYALMVCDSASYLDFEGVQDQVISRWFQWLKTDIQPFTTALFLSNEVVTIDQRFTAELRKWASQRVALYEERGAGQVMAVAHRNSATTPPAHKTRLLFNSSGVLVPEYELIRLGLDIEVLRRGGSWIKYDDYILGEGVRRAVSYLSREPRLAEVIRERIQSALS